MPQPDRLAPGQSFGNLGIGSNMVEVPETAVYQSADKSVSRRYRAGTLIPKEDARAFGIVPSAPSEPIPDVQPLEEAELGEIYARCLTAAGYELAKAEATPVTNNDQERAELAAKRAEAEAKAEKPPSNKKQPNPENKAEPKTENKS